MYTSIQELTKYRIFHYFSEVSRIPRCSGKEQQMSDYLVSFAHKHRLQVIQDEAKNVIIKKPATFGYEFAPTVIIHGNMDMVCEKNRDNPHDFNKDPLELRIEGDMLYATDTSLGADSGVAIAYALALLDSKHIPHPNLEVMLTTEEKTTMNGAKRIDPALLNGSILISIDAEEEGTLLVSSAGGVIAEFTIPIMYDKRQPDTVLYDIHIGGLKGGHSGGSIVKGRGNANILLGRVLQHCAEHFDYQLVHLRGGAKANTIPREAEATIAIERKHIPLIHSFIFKWDETLKKELDMADPEVYVQCTSSMRKGNNVFSQETMTKVITALTFMPNSVQSMSTEVPGLVQSSNNLGTMRTNSDHIMLKNEIRSSVYSLQEHISQQMKVLARLLQSRVIFHSEYPAWPYHPTSNIRSLCKKIYKETYNEEVTFVSTHAGIECGILVKKMDVDAVCIGPDIHNIDTPSEHLSISSTLKTWEYLLTILKEMNTM
ncbi:dipeptidase D [Bacillus thermophilus]|uniref:Dipeptidase D n=1 Tax=Siminovitchia thermophila TaxID=1245522 RepID=A0ABS2R2R8_9BACI|nr:beta-Ala-His dipeptidase [Siminovitchia thermophila]MBM7713931.1 dipeptidase D [Siminovitchia thermophila]ONK23817.1 aminoacyl-histidine dipeptidase [Bacillus sp. VT-16-64]